MSELIGAVAPDAAATTTPDREAIRQAIVASMRDAFPSVETMTDAVLAALPGRTEAEVKAEALWPVREALASHPRVCDTHPDGDPITCGWKWAVADVERALREATP